MHTRFIHAALIYSCLSASLALAADEQGALNTNPPEVDPNVEETLVIGSTRSGDYTIITEDAEKLVNTAGAFGDPLGAIFALPGVNFSNSQEPAVRGSSPSDNVFVVDFMPASYIFHEFGVSVFSEFILHDFQMYSAGFGPEYSDATGAVFDVRLREPNIQSPSGVLDLSMLRSGIFFETGVTKNSAFYLSARRSLLDLFVNADEISEDGVNVTKVPRETDYQAKYAWYINDNHRISLSANGAGDVAEAELTSEADFVASNPDFEGDARVETLYSGAALLWEYSGDGGTDMKLGFNQLSDEENVYWGDDYDSEIQSDNVTAKGLISVPLGDHFRARAGSQLSEKQLSYYLDAILFVCTEFDPDCDLRRSERITERDEVTVKEGAHHIDFSWMPSDAWVFDVGAQYQYNDYTEEEFVHPRVAATWHVTDSLTLTSKAGSYNRFPDLETVLPETGNPDLKSPTADHYTLGFEKEFNDGWSLAIEAYYKELQDLPRALNAEEPNSTLRYVNETEGTARGVDIMLNKNLTDKWWGWIAFSIGESERTNLKSGETKEYVLDTPFIANWVMNYQATPRFNIGWRWSVRSGQAYTPITGVQENPWFEDSVLPVYGEAFSERLPYYNRLDVRMQWDMLTFGRESALILDIINALNYSNVNSRNLDYQKVSQVGDPVVTEDSEDLGITPAITYRLIF